jgi:hypothetical protein
MRKYLFKLALLIVLTSLLSICFMSRGFTTEKLKILLPLYAYPNWYNPETYLWDRVARSGKEVSIVAIINPDNGPNNTPPNADYQKGLAALESSKIEVLGYIYTKYGDRPFKEIKADIDTYFADYKVAGFFFDEAASGVDRVNYYRTIYQYIKSKDSSKKIFLNQGTNAVEEYLKLPVADTIVIFENYGRSWLDYQPNDYQKNYSIEHFAALIHSSIDQQTMEKYLGRALANKIQYVYVTDDSPDAIDGNPWNSLPSYWQAEIECLKSLNCLTKKQ